jgi:hypothetical protein
MSYIVNKTDGTVLTTLLDGTTNTDTGLTLIGRNYISYGEIQNENFVKLLENFASTLPPGQSVGFTPIAGQLWWDTGTQRLKIYNGTEFIPISEQTSSATAPTVVKTGDQWWDTTNKQLKVYNGSGWTLIAPLYTESQGKSGAIVETVTDVDMHTHTVVNTYTNNHLISVSSYDPSFLTGAYDQFSYINPGITLASNVMIYGNVMNSQQLGGAWANTFPRTTVRTDFLSDLSVAGNLVLGNANVSFTNNTLVIKNSQLYSNVDVYVNTTTGNTRAMRINGTTGMITVASDPTNNLGVVTKQFVDNVNATLSTSIVSNVSTINNTINTLRTNIYTDLTGNVNILTASIGALRTDTNANTAATNLALSTNVATINANLANKTTRIESLESSVPLKAPIASPEFTGTPTAPTPSANDNSTAIATTEYVDLADALLTTYINTQASAVAGTAASNLAAGLALKANLISPAFSGTPTLSASPTTLSWNTNSRSVVAGDNSTNLATTAFVAGSIANQKFVYTVSPNAPSGGNDGDFWFQIG